MKKRVFAILACVLALALLLTGCVRTEVGVNLNSDGSGSVGTIVLIQKKAYDMMKESGDPFEGKETFVETIDDEEYIGTKENTEYGSADEMKSALLALTFAGNISDAEKRVADKEPENLTGEIVIHPDVQENDSEQAVIFKSADIEKSGGKFTFRAALQPQTDMASEELSDIGVNNIYKLKVAVTMPGEIKSNSAGTVSGKTVTWDITDLTTENSIEIVSDVDDVSIVPVIVIAVLILILIAAVVVLLAKKKQQK
jgi:hypothetical protein